MLVRKEILENRRPSIDIYRGIAILLVVLFHFDHLLEIGFIGVDLFFVISGYLVSRVLLKELKNKEKTNWKSFVVKRLTKILPSYYFFIIGGTILARLLLLENHSDQVINMAELRRYLFFYLNYAMTFNWSFELAWSICVEEHFYLFLILFFVALTGFSFIRNKSKIPGILFPLLIIISIAFKFIGFYQGWDTYSTTHMRMDALFLGVYLSYLEINREKVKTNSPIHTIIGIAIIGISVSLFYLTEIPIFRPVFLHTLIPLGFFCLIRGTLFYSFKPLHFLRVLAYYSYNWYLWHALTAYVILNLLDLNKSIAFILYLITSFVIAVLTTKLIEEPVLKLRKKILN